MSNNLCDILYYVTKGIRNKNLLIWDLENNKYFPPVDAIVLYDGYVCPIWKEYESEINTFAAGNNGRMIKQKLPVYVLYPLVLMEDNKLALSEISVKFLRKNTSIEEAIKKFNIAAVEFDENEFTILHIK